MGLLTIDGTLDLSQFWPLGESDADTTKLVIDITGLGSPVRYQAFPNSAVQATNVYDTAYVRNGSAKVPVIKNGKLTVRLQGLDAPELHYQPSSMAKTKWKGKALGKLGGLKRPDGKPIASKYRQSQGETAAVKLAAFLAGHTEGPTLPVRFVTSLDHEEGPGAAIDKYGRFVGNVVLDSGGEPLDVNLWILGNGLALVALYNSMRREEIEACVQAYATGSSAQGGIVRYVSKKILTFDGNLLYRKKSSSVEAEGAAKFIHPKLFRRQTTWWAYKTAKTFTSGFDTFLGLSKDDKFFETADFLNSGPLSAVQIPIKDMVAGGKVVYSADEVVFKEASSTLLDVGGAKIETW